MGKFQGRKEKGELTLIIISRIKKELTVNMATEIN